VLRRRERRLRWRADCAQSFARWLQALQLARRPHPRAVDPLKALAPPPIGGADRLCPPPPPTGNALRNASTIAAWQITPTAELPQRENVMRKVLGLAALLCASMVSSS